MPLPPHGDADHTDIGRLQVARAPLLQPASQPPGYEQPNSDGVENGGASAENGKKGTAPLTLPLTLGPLGSPTMNRTFDDRKSTNDDFKFKNLKRAFVWKTRVETYLICCVPAISRILL